MCISPKGDNVHAHLLPKYSHIAVCMCKCQGHGIGHKDSWIRVKAKRRS